MTPIGDADKTVIANTTHLYEDDGLLIVAVMDERQETVEAAIAAGHDAGWKFYFRADKHNVVYLVFLF